MSTYRYTLSDFHAIKSADIKIDGITVLAGENGCGKSTLSRWLYYLINGTRLFNEFTMKNYIKKLNDVLNRNGFVLRDLRRTFSREDMSQSSSINSLRHIIPFDEDDRISEEDINKIQEYFTQSINEIGEQIGKYLEKLGLSARRDRILAYLGIEELKDETSSENIAEIFKDKNIRLLNKLTAKLIDDINSRPLDRFIENIKHRYEETDKAPQNIQLFEDNVELIDDNQRVSELFNLHRAIYIDTPMALTNESSENVFWNELREYILDDKINVDIKRKKILLRIKNILHGEAKMIKTESPYPYSEEELRYVSNNGKINIEIEKTATGFKTFTYLQRLIENGCLNDESLLLIDEPEAHLHPQWIVEFARLLIIIHKELGVKIMIATHNPDMVAAIRSISEKEEILDRINFYIAKNELEQLDDVNQYSYKYLGGEIGEIFSSFNIALSRIQAYGTGD